jgi:hypothetical protein
MRAEELATEFGIAGALDFWSWLLSGLTLVAPPLHLKVLT